MPSFLILTSSLSNMSPAGPEQRLQAVSLTREYGLCSSASRRWRPGLDGSGLPTLSGKEEALRPISGHVTAAILSGAQQVLPSTSPPIRLGKYCSGSCFSPRSKRVQGHLIFAQAASHSSFGLRPT